MTAQARSARASPGRSTQAGRRWARSPFAQARERGSAAGCCGRAVWRRRGVASHRRRCARAGNVCVQAQGAMQMRPRRRARPLARVAGIRSGLYITQTVSQRWIGMEKCWRACTYKLEALNVPVSCCANATEVESEVPRQRRHASSYAKGCRMKRAAGAARNAKGGAMAMELIHSDVRTDYPLMLFTTTTKKITYSASSSTAPSRSRARQSDRPPT
jgi:hypothetical protein